ncbi:hypothetical protein MCOR27_005409 [Pyricularia oryzae]|nr:hypothetical protein MCOR01_007415 [Pyricularia oryzae]KAI6260218.1 hypothetical protein MCOR19_003451 [Pyricularia oryzae]KAI6278863.1 hypothetical protein MCOR27_005409 [Pyricularia oryzae]KAI6278996.1 hypothetical protein MCOR26_004375 [Pyricularia oryzae]KAI6309251.1 hypothetical protein MCOR34_006859 [Pyricularia oryzae]
MKFTTQNNGFISRNNHQYANMSRHYSTQPLMAPEQGGYDYSGHDEYSQGYDESQGGYGEPSGSGGQGQSSAPAKPKRSKSKKKSKKEAKPPPGKSRSGYN